MDKCRSCYFQKRCKEQQHEICSLFISKEFVEERKRSVKKLQPPDIRPVEKEIIYPELKNICCSRCSYYSPGSDIRNSMCNRTGEYTSCYNKCKKFINNGYLKIDRYSPKEINPLGYGK